MIKKLKEFLQSPDKKVVLKNFFSLSVLQGLNLILPLLTYPYLARVIGVDNLGLIFFVSALITYFQVLTDYSFNMTATKEIAVNAGNTEKIHEIFNDVFSSKIFLLLCSFVVLCLVVFTIPFFSEHRLIYLLTFGNIVGLSLFPVWFFQGMQQMKYITYINFFCKLLFTAAIFVFVNGPQDMVLVPLFTALGFISSGLLSLWYLKKDFKVIIKRQPFVRIKEQIRQGRYIFLSEFKITLFTNTNTVLLGFIAGNAAVGYFSTAEKLARAIGNFCTPFTLALFPYMSKEMYSNSEKAYKSVLKITGMGTLIFLVVLIPVFIFADQLIVLVFGKEMVNSILIFRILLFIPIASFLDNMFGKQILLNIGKDKFYFRVILIATLCNIAMNIYLTTYYSYKGTAISLLITQILIDIGMYYYATREIKKIINNKHHA
jgi:polysaccharide transporter, PST family